MHTKFQKGQLVYIVDKWGDVESIAIIQHVCRPYTVYHYELVGHPVVYYTEEFLREVPLKYAH